MSPKYCICFRDISNSILSALEHFVEHVNTEVVTESYGKNNHNNCQLSAFSIVLYLYLNVSLYKSHCINHKDITTPMTKPKMTSLFPHTHLQNWVILRGKVQSDQLQDIDAISLIWDVWRTWVPHCSIPQSLFCHLLAMWLHAN